MDIIIFFILALIALDTIDRQCARRQPRKPTRHEPGHYLMHWEE